jgi:cell division cycle 14
MADHPQKKIVYCVSIGRRNVTHAAFLLGAYLVLALKQSPEGVWERFRTYKHFEHYRDATYSPSRFNLTLLDCWRGLASGESLGWIGKSPDDGMYDMEEYDHYNSSINGELHMVVPGKFFAFRGPKSTFNGQDYEDVDGTRTFSPSYYVNIFRELGVSTVIRLNAPQYNPSAFMAAGIEHYDLPFDDCTPPSQAVVARFLRIVDAAPGAIAVHCLAGLGRTGTLVAVFLMLAHGFTARDAIAWLRVIRPGCVIGEQQRYLCQVEAQIAAAALRGRSSLPAQPPPQKSIPPPLPESKNVVGTRKCLAGGDGGEGMVRFPSQGPDDMMQHGPAELARQVAAAVARRV